MSFRRLVRVARPRLTALTVGLVLGAVGVAGAAVGINQVASSQVKNESLTGADVKNGSLFSADIRDGGILGADVKADTITGREISERTLGVPANISQELAATDVANAAAGNAVPETTLLSRGDLSLTATCWRQADTGALHADLFLSTKVNGALMQGTVDSKSGGTAAAQFLNIDTPRGDRRVASPDGPVNSFKLTPGAAGAPYDLAAWSPGGDYMRGNVSVVLQNGVVQGVTPPLAAGNRCHVVGFVSAVIV